VKCSATFTNEQDFQPRTLDIE